MKDTWTKPEGVRSRVESGDGWGWGKGWEENGDDYLNNNKKCGKK